MGAVLARGDFCFSLLPFTSCRTARQGILRQPYSSSISCALTRPSGPFREPSGSIGEHFTVGAGCFCQQQSVTSGNFLTVEIPVGVGGQLPIRGVNWPVRFMRMLATNARDTGTKVVIKGIAQINYIRYRHPWPEPDGSSRGELAKLITGRTLPYYVRIVGVPLEQARYTANHFRL